jgi:signal transduction histidine kinase
MRWPIHLQLLLPMLAVVVVAIALASGAVAYWRVNQVRQQQQDNLRRVAATMAESPFPPHKGALKQMSGLSGADFVMLDVTGEVESSTVTVSAGDAETLLAVPPARDWEDFSTSPVIRLGEHNYLASRVPLTRRLLTSSGHEGMLVVLYREDRWTKTVREAAYPSLLAGGLMVVAVVLVTSVLARRLVRPIERLGRQAAAIAAGDFTSIDVGSRNDELRDLAVSINRMAEKLGRYEEEVRRSERMRTLGQLGAGMAHQLRNAATGASMAIELHQRECSSAAAESLDVALRQLRLMESYLQRFLALGRSRPTPHESVPLAALVEDVLGLVRPMCLHGRIELGFAPPAEPLAVWGDPESLRQLLVNLVLNAVEAARGHDTPPRVVIELARQDDGRALIRVKDSGPGPADATKDRLFEPFVTNKADGTGLGLYVARQIAEAHQGAIAWKRCDDMTCFEVELPCKAHNDTA